MQKCGSPGGRCEGAWEGVTVVSIMRLLFGKCESHLGHVGLKKRFLFLQEL